MLGHNATPGPWSIAWLHNARPKRDWRIYGGDNRTPIPYGPIAASDVGPHAFNEANAALIAAAPSMLDALTDAFTLIGSLLVDDSMSATLDPDTRDALANWHTETGKLLGVTA